MKAYRYQWTPSDTTAPTTLGAEFSGFIDFSIQKGIISKEDDLSQIVSLQFKGKSIEAQVQGGKNLPAISAVTYGKEDVVFIPIGENPSALKIVWDEKKITYMGSGTTLRIQKGTGDVYGLISDTTVQSFFPQDYFLNEAAENGSWNFQGRIDSV